MSIKHRPWICKTSNDHSAQRDGSVLTIKAKRKARSPCAQRIHDGRELRLRLSHVPKRPAAVVRNPESVDRQLLVANVVWDCKAIVISPSVDTVVTPAIEEPRHRTLIASTHFFGGL